MNIRPSAAIRQNYNEIADFCKKSGEPVFLTKNGEGDLVVMDITAFDRREKMLKLREELLAVEEDRLRGEAGYSVGEVASMMRSAIKEAAHGETDCALYSYCIQTRDANAGISRRFFGTGKPGCGGAFGRFA